MKKSIAMILAVLMLVAMLPISALAANDYTINSTTSTDDYYNLISKKDWEIAPGITESEIVLNNDAGSQRQVIFVMEADLNNEYVKVINSYNGMVPEYGNYKTGVMSEQAAYAEANGYGNVVGAMNTCLSWYKDYPADRVGEPLGFIMLDAETLFDPANCGYVYGNVGFPSVLVINKDFDENGNPRPADIPKVEMPQIRSSADLDGWEEQVIPASSGYIVKDGVNTNNPSHTGGAPRSVVGIKADGTVVIMVNDGRQAPYSEGMSMYELAEVMLDLGCTYAVNCDGGGSTTWLSQRPGEELKVNNSPSDGAERETTSGILFISTAPATGEFVRANISSEYDYYTPNSVVKFDAIGTDLVGTEAEIPADAVWQLKDSSFGTIENGVFTSTGKLGAVTVQLVYNDEVVGEDSINIVMPDKIEFAQSNMVIPYGRDVEIVINATYDSKPVVIKPSDVVFELSNPALGTLNGFTFSSAEEGTEPEPGTLKATIGELTIVANIALGKGTEIAYDFEDQNLEGWSIWTNYPQYGPNGPNGALKDANGNYWYHGQNERGYLSIVDATTGKVRNGKYALAMECDFSQPYETGFHALNMKFPKIDTTDAVSVGFWIYVPYDARHADLTINSVLGEKFFADGSAYELVGGWNYVKLNAPSAADGFYDLSINVDERASAKDANGNDYYNYITEPNLNGKYTFYIDDISVDYSTAVDDRENPVFSAPMLLDTVGSVNATISGQTINFNNPTLEVRVDDFVADNATGLNSASAKAYIDGYEVACTFSNNKISVNGVILADGVHTVKFVIADNAGNSSYAKGIFVVDAGTDASTIKVVPQNPDADKLLVGSLYWMDVVATDIEKVQKVEMTFDLNNASYWELEGMTVAAGFTADWSVQADENIATITITRTGKNDATGEAAIASFPVRTWESHITEYEGYENQTPATLVKRGIIWHQAIELILERGVVTYIDESIGTFGMERVLVDTELYFNNYTRKNVSGAQAWIDACKAAGVGFHEHTAVAVADKAADCTNNGYEGRTFCEGCNSVVDWGTIVPATGHTYKVVGNQLVCDCGDVYTENGLITIGGTAYYVAAGKLIGGWIDIDGAWYYFDATTFNSVETYNNGYVTFEFEADGKLTSGEWHHTSKGSRYYYGPAYYTGRKGAARWYEIDGKNYCFPEDGYCYKGIRFVDDSQEPVYTWYNFGTDGAMIEKFDYTGPYAYAGRMYYIENGVSALGMYKYEGAYYYGAAGDHFAAIQNTTRFCYINRDLLPEGTYTFGADGKMVDNALYTVDNVLYYFELGNISSNVDTFTIDGVAYNVDENGKVLYTGLYTDASGVEQNYVDGVVTKIIKNGLIGDYYYINDVKAPAYYGLVEWEGNYYYINDYGKIFKNGRKYLNKINGLTFPNGDAIPQAYFEFDADGKMIIKQGIVDDMYYVNGVAVKPFYGLVEWEGNFYYVNAEGTLAKIIKNQTKYVNKTNGLTFADGTPVAVGYYEFDADGKMIVKQGLVDDQYFVNGIALPAYYGLIEWEGNFYYINDYGRIVKNTRKYLNKINGLTFPNGDAIPQAYFEFDADGKMIIKQGIVDDMYYINGVAVKPFYGLVEWKGNFYYVNAEGTQAKIVKNQTKYVNKTNGLTFADGTPVTEGYYEFDADGKMIVKQGLVDDQYFVNGIALPAYYGLIEWEGNFYYINDYGRIVKNTRKYVNKTNGLTFADGMEIQKDYFYFDAEGKMIID